MKDGALQLSDIAGTITMLEIACSRCERRGRLRMAELKPYRRCGASVLVVREG